MAILVVGSVALDDIQSPYGKVQASLGGSATFFALAASYFTQVRVIAVVGEDFGKQHEEVFRKHGVDIAGIEHASGKTFHWSGEYGENPNDCKMHGNINPHLQSEVRSQMRDAKFVGLDTHPFWIETTPQQLAQAIHDIDIMIINDGEARQFAKDHNLLRSANKILALGPKALVIKHGEYGATVFFQKDAFGFGRHPFRAPALPLDEVRDPTGAGDAFAGGFLGYIASQGKLSAEVLKRAMFYGGVMGGFAVERFGTERLLSLTRQEIDARFQLFREMSHLE